MPWTPTSTPTITYTPTNTMTPIPTWTPTPTQEPEEFKISRNVYHPDQDPILTIDVATREYPGVLILNIYNSAGEHIKVLEPGMAITGPYAHTYTWDGTNKYGNKVASGVYIIYEIKPMDRLLGKVIVIR
jgi:flagellar hook assembly protein FlgD